MSETIRAWCQRYKKGLTPYRHISFKCDKCGDRSDWELGNWRTYTSLEILSGNFELDCIHGNPRARLDFGQ